MNLFYLLVILSIVIKVTLSEDVQKCCNSDEILTRQEDSYKCIQDVTKRLQIKTSKTNFLPNNTAGKCTDILDNKFVIYNIDSNEIQLIYSNYFPKCCPLNTIYDSKLHSCKEKYVNDNYITEHFLKIGLTNCKTVADFSLNHTDDFEYKLLDNTQKIKRNSLEDISSFCIDVNEKDLFVIRECQESFDSCAHLKCIKKCCPDGQSYVGSKCVDSYEHGLNLSVLSHAVQNHEDDYAIIHNRTCPKIYKMSNFSNITIHNNGSFTEWTLKGPRTENVTDMNSYCIEHYVRKNTKGYFVFHCFPEEPNELTKFDYRLWPFILSCIFLMLTVLVYIIIKECRKMFGKILVNYCIASFCVFVILTLGQLLEDPTSADCQLRAFFLIFFAISQFSWANVMSFEIWCTFGTTKIYLGSKQKEVELRKFLLYSLYGWGAPLILTLITLLFYEWRVLPYVLQPFLAEKKCFFDTKPGNYAKFLFMNVPLLIIQMINMVFFFKTVIYCVKVRNEINKINEQNMTQSTNKFHHDRERLFLIIKLSIVMGISYIFEVITGFFDMSQLGTAPKYIEIILDIFNALQGVFIFVIFICKKKILLALAQKFNLFGVVYTPNTSSVRTHSSLTLNGVALSSVGNQSSQKLV